MYHKESLFSFVHTMKNINVSKGLFYEDHLSTQRFSVGVEGNESNQNIVTEERNHN